LSSHRAWTLHRVACWVIGQSDLEPLAHRAIPSLGRRWSGYSVPVACSAYRWFKRAFGLGRGPRRPFGLFAATMGDLLPDESPSGLGRSGFLPASCLGIIASLRMGEELFHWSPQWQGIGFRGLTLRQTPSYPEVRRC